MVQEKYECIMEKEFCQEENGTRTWATDVGIEMVIGLIVCLNPSVTLFLTKVCQGYNYQTT